MNNKEYIIKEVRILYRYILEDKEEFKSKKHLYARIYNNLERNSMCDCGGLDTLGFTKEEIKQMIKEEIENYKE